MIDLTPEVVRENLSYDPETGFFRWLIPAPGRRVDGVAGYLNSLGYRQIRIHGKTFYEHRLAYAYMMGRWPLACIDHINGLGHDNRWANLRPATSAENSGNQRQAQSSNKSSGLLGVARGKGGRWDAKIQVSGKSIRLGCFDTAEQAHAVYLIKKRELHSHCAI